MTFSLALAHSRSRSCSTLALNADMRDESTLLSWKRDGKKIEEVTREDLGALNGYWVLVELLWV